MIREVTKALKPRKVESDHGTSLRVACAIFGVGTAEMARELGVTPSAVDKFKRTKKFNSQRLETVASFFGMSVSQFEGMAHKALSESVTADCAALTDHLREYHPNKSDELAQIRRYYAKITALLQEIEGVA